MKRLIGRTWRRVIISSRHDKIVTKNWIGSTHNPSCNYTNLLHTRSHRMHFQHHNDKHYHVHYPIPHAPRLSCPSIITSYRNALCIFPLLH